ncbi:MAG: hypothetical protein ACOYLX_00860 [Burkholderiaceae bacterium]
MAQRIGRARCPLCGSEQAWLGASSKRLAYVTCPEPSKGGCGQQTFARSDRSDAALRALHIVEPTDPPPTAPPPAPDPAPADPPPARSPFSIFGF